MNPLHKNQAGQPSTNGGHFAAAPAKDEGAVSLTVAPVMVTVELQQWVNDDAVFVDSVEFDARTILDSLALDKFDPDAADNDHIFEAAVNLGLTPKHDGPFTVRMDDESVEEYMANRRAAGQTAPLTGKPRRTVEQLAAAKHELDVQRDALDDREFKLAKEAVETVVLEQFPNAAEIELWSARDYRDDAPWQVATVRDGEDETLWNSDDNPLPIALDFSPSLGLDIESLYHDADDTHEAEWYGIIVGR